MELRGAGFVLAMSMVVVGCTESPPSPYVDLGPRADGDVPAEDMGPGPARLEVLMGPTSWTNLVRSIGVSPDGRVYVTDGETVFRVMNGAVDSFLTAEDLNGEVDAVTVDPDGNVHVLGATFNDTIQVVSPDGETITTHDTSEFIFPGYITALSSSHAIFVSRDGLVSTNPAPPAVLYSDAAVGGSTISCASEAVAAAGERVYFLPGCNGTPVYGGLVDGSRMGILIDDEPIHDRYDNLGFNGFIGFNGIAAHPTDGIVANMEQLLVHIRDDGTFSEIRTTPRLYLEEDYDFHSAPIAVSATDIYLLADNTVFVVRDVL